MVCWSTPTVRPVTWPYGDQRRLEIARCMVTQPEILMLDEPAAGLNPKETKELDELIAELRNHHNTHHFVD
ncbi:leucine/isoleucine/valine transporter ATP-binding subunit [Citrobacter freundii]|nr:leucine/isoleucine/valine transporter ATP-binding subunit [Citrobacter freundii]